MNSKPVYSLPYTTVTWHREKRISIENWPGLLLLIAARIFLCPMVGLNIKMVFAAIFISLIANIRYQVSYVATAAWFSYCKLTLPVLIIYNPNWVKPIRSVSIWQKLLVEAVLETNNGAWRDLISNIYGSEQFLLKSTLHLLFLSGKAIKVFQCF